MFAVSPDVADLWCVSQLAHCLGVLPRFDKIVQSAVVHNVLGGFWYGAALFAYWIKSQLPGNEASRRRILTTLLGTAIAVFLMILAEKIYSWPPPLRLPALAQLYPKYIYLNPGANSFPSQSSTLYAAVSAGIYSINKRLGWFMWLGVVFLVGLPRVYLGGHYPADVIAGMVIGFVSFEVARRLFEPTLVVSADRWMQGASWREILSTLAVFAWLLLVATEFRDFEWLGKLTTALLK